MTHLDLSRQPSYNRDIRTALLKFVERLNTLVKVSERVCHLFNRSNRLPVSSCSLSSRGDSHNGRSRSSMNSPTKKKIARL